MTYQRNPSQQPAPKPYAMVSLPAQRPRREAPAGQDRFRSDHYHGQIALSLTLQTPLHISTGIAVPGRDLKLPLPLVKTMALRKGRLVIPGTSLKGVIRSIYEAITPSCICKSKAIVDNDLRECKIDKSRERTHVCAACRVFGALNWQGLVGIADAVCEKSQVRVGFLPSLYQPRPQIYTRNGRIAGRKFYYCARTAVDRGQGRGISVLQAPSGSLFKTTIRFANLRDAELGALFTALGLHPKHRFALRIGGGKPVGMGTALVTIDQMEYARNLRNRYQAFDEAGTEVLSGTDLETFINQMTEAAGKGNSPLLQNPQLAEIGRILAWPTDRHPPEGMY